MKRAKKLPSVNEEKRGGSSKFFCCLGISVGVFLSIIIAVFVATYLQIKGDEVPKESRDDPERPETEISRSRVYDVWLYFESPFWSVSGSSTDPREKAKHLLIQADHLLRSNTLKSWYRRSLITSAWSEMIVLEVSFDFPNQPAFDSRLVEETLTDVFVHLSNTGLLTGKWTISITGNDMPVTVSRLKRQADQPCGIHKRECDDGVCVYNGWWCNGVAECLDGSDEQDCTQTKQYPSTPPKTVKLGKSANDRGNTLGGEFGHIYTSTPYSPVLTTQPSKLVEFPDFSCRDGTFQCSDRACIPLTWVCDNITDCRDRSDETERACRRSFGKNSLYSNITDVRMSNRTSPFAGHVEVLYDGEWGGICDDFWGEEEASVVCRMLHPGLRSSPRHQAHFGLGMDRFWLDGLQCTGREDSLLQCPGNPLGKVDCEPQEAAGVVCSPRIERVRLVGGDGPHQGRVEILVNGTWGSICGVEGAWTKRAGQVVCRMLNISGRVFSVRGTETRALFGEGSGRMWIERMACAGDEQSLDDCPSSSTGDLGVVGDVTGSCLVGEAGLSCGVAVCNAGYSLCGDNRTCIDEAQICDREIDCPDLSDEKNCSSSCDADEFTCANTRTCINMTNVCNGEFDCADGTDEMSCVDKRDDGAVRVRRNSEWLIVCYNETVETELGEAYCKAMGTSGLYQVSPMRNQEIGIRLLKRPAGSSPISGFQFSTEENCRPLTVDCFSNECGLRGPRPVDSFIRNGVNARVAEWRWQVRLMKSRGFSCGGSIISPTRILTANHCVRNSVPSSLKIVVGDTNRLFTQEFEKTHLVKSIWSHPAYRRRGNFVGRLHSVNDVAILELTEPIKMDRYAGPVCLPEEETTLSDHCFITGWGRDEDDDRVYNLQESKVTVYNYTECNDMFPSLPNPILPSMVCVTQKTGYSPAGHGDSGGPLVCRSSSGRWVQIGIAGYLPLGRFRSGENLSVYHSVVYFKDFIREQTNKGCLIVCDGGTKCLGKTYVCDGKSDCLDGTDETLYCGLDCDFEKNITCGLTVSPGWQLYNFSRPTRYPFHNGTYMLQKYVGGDGMAHFSSPIVNTTAPGCLAFSANGPNSPGRPSQLSIVSIRQNGQNQTVTFPRLSGPGWARLQVNISAGVSRIIFNSTVPSEDSYLAIDDIRMLPGHCPPLECLGNQQPCSGSQMCVPSSRVCDTMVDCPDGSDEPSQCAQAESVNCDFGDKYRCGYRQEGLTHDWRRMRGNDHTYKTNPVECSNAMADVVVLLNVSPQHLSPTRFSGLMNSVEKVVESLPVGSDGVRIAAISYSNNSRLVFKLNQFNTSADVIQALNRIQRTVLLAPSDNAFFMARDQVFLPEKGNRPGVPQVIILLTAGPFSDPVAMRLNAEDIKSQGYIVFVVGIAFRPSRDDLLEISSGRRYTHHRPSGTTEILDSLCAAIVRTDDFYLQYSPLGNNSTPLESPVFELTEASCYEFYHRGRYGNLTVSVKKIAEDMSSEQVHWFLFGNHQIKWRLGQINLSPGRYQVLFKVIYVELAQLDIDDIIVRSGQCSSSVNSCDSRDFACANGQCIPFIQSCDLRAHCMDGSDVPLHRTPVEQFPSTVRLSDSSTTGYFTVEIFHDEEWRRVCSDLTMSERFIPVLCRTIGYTGYVAGPIQSAEGTKWLSNVTCDSSAESLENCSRAGWIASSVCQSGSITLNCFPKCPEKALLRSDYGQSNPELYPYQRIRLTGGRSPMEGRLEILYNNTWGTICRDGWTEREARVACRTMGYLGQGRVIENTSPGTGPIWLDDVTCDDTSLNLFNCTHADVNRHDCSHYEDVAIRCEPSDCEVDQIPCSDNKTCIESRNRCDGEADCPGGEDERQCVIACAADEFVCDRNNVCLEQQDRCNGLMDCEDGTDETGCVAVRDDGVSLVFADNRMHPVCYQESIGMEMADSFCKALGERGAYQASAGNTTEMGTLLSNSNSSGVLQNFAAIVDRPCTPLISHCVKKDCGRNNEDSVPRKLSDEWTGEVDIYMSSRFISKGTILSSRFVVYNTKRFRRDFSRLSVSVNNRSISVAGQTVAGTHALLELESSAYDAQPPCLPGPTNLTTLCYITNVYMDPRYGDRVIRTVKVGVYDDVECRQRFPDISLRNPSLCLTLGTSRSPVCDGETDYNGTSLLCEDSAGFWTLIGTYDTQPFGCVRENGEENIAVFSPIEADLLGIRDKMGCNFSCDGNRCLRSEFQICDGVFDCLDKSDEPKTCGVTCRFEDRGLCGYRPGDQNTPWSYTYSNSTRTGPGHFLSHRPSRSTRQFLSTITQSPVFEVNTTSCFEFYYFMPSHRANLRVERITIDNGTTTNVTDWSLSNRQGRRWRLGQIELPSGKYRMVFRASSLVEDVEVYLDDTTLKSGECFTSVISCALDEFQCETGNCIMLEDSCDQNFPSCPNNFTYSNCSNLPRLSIASDIRLVGGVNEGEGRVEILHNGVWGTVCDDAFGAIDAEVVCRSMGYSSGSVKNVIRGTGQIWLDQVDCTGRERHIKDCSHNGWGIHDCFHSEDVGVQCFSSDLVVRLVGGDKLNEGRVEIFHDAQWGTVCDDGFDERDVIVVCRMLGYSTGQSLGSTRFRAGTGRIWLTNLACTGNEPSVYDCRHNGWGRTSLCFHSEDVGVRCSGTYIRPENRHPTLPKRIQRNPDRSVDKSVRLVGGLKSNEGRVEVLLDGQWGTICNDSWDDKDSTAVCRTLGYFSGSAVSIGGFGFGTGPIWMDDVNCTLNATDIFNCSSAEYGIHDCTHYQDVAIRCYNCQALVCDEATQCIPSNSTCDGISDCLDGKDEDNCDDSLPFGNLSIFDSSAVLGKDNFELAKWGIQCNVQEFVSFHVELSDNGQLRKDYAPMLSLNNEWYPICYEESLKMDVAQPFCKAMGKVHAYAVMPSNSTELGVEIYRRRQSSALSLHSPRKRCHTMRVECVERGCGIKGPNKASRFVPGGMETTSEEWPWYATIVDLRGRIVCSACVVAPSWVVTNARCITRANMNSYRVVVGKDYANFTNTTEQVFGVKGLFSARSGSSSTNLRLVELNVSIHLTPSVRPICLPNTSTVFTQQCYALGEEAFGQDGRAILRKTQVAVYDSTNCTRNYSLIGSLARGINCVVRDDRFDRTCKVLPGEPVVCKTDTGKWALHSVSIFYNSYHCKVTPYLPLSQTRLVVPELSWMEEAINCMKCDGGCISQSRLCDGFFDCRDKMDETVYCGSARNCSFDYASKCGYTIGGSSTSPWRVREGSVNDYVISANSSTTAINRHFTSGRMNVRTRSCLKLSFFLEEGIMEIVVFNGSGVIAGVTRISSDAVLSKWSSTHVPLFPGASGIRFTAHRSATVSLDNITVTDEQCPMSHCSSDEFECNQFACIPLSSECDGKLDCPNGEDEGQRCVNCDPLSEFQCHNGFCVNQTAVCDSKVDCLDGSDEFNCSCAGFSCDRGKTCISYSLFCDHVVDCEDLSDETNCGSCGFTQRRCDNNFCRPARYWCDGEDDCLDGTDESNCTCTSEEYRCGDGRCIVSSWKCDGFQDCPDNSDERNCSACQVTERVCGDYSCVPVQAWCNGTAECPDASDEGNCFTFDRNETKSGVLMFFTGKKSTLPVCGHGWTPKASESLCEAMGLGNATSTSSSPFPGTDFLVLKDGQNGRPGLLNNLERDTCPGQEAVHVTCSGTDCGKMPAGSRHYQPFIVGGEVSSPGSWPWLALLYYQKSPRCGATIIDDEWLVTAAHCVKERRLPFYFEILSGTVNKDQPGPTAQRRTVDRIYVHGNFSSSRSTLPGDIALLHLSAPLNRTSHVRPICLPRSETNFPLSTTCFSAGFGAVVRGSKSLVSKMREGKLRLWSDNRCLTAYRNRISTRDKVCAGYASGIITPCFGDSGGPLMCQITKGRWTFAGVISIGEANCEKGTSFGNVKPSAFTRITSYIDWIKQTTGLTYL